MSTKEKELIRSIEALPNDMQDRFADMVAGAALAVEAMSSGEEKR